MTKYLTSLLVVIMILFPLTSVAQNTEAPVKKIKQMLYPTVMVDLAKREGSGTIIFSDFRKHISDTGLSQKLQQQRTMQAEGMQNMKGKAKEYATLKNEIAEIIKGIRMELKDDKKMTEDFRKWLELEDITASLFMESAKKRRR